MVKTFDTGFAQSLKFLKKCGNWQTSYPDLEKSTENECKVLKQKINGKKPLVFFSKLQEVLIITGLNHCNLVAEFQVHVNFG